MLNKNLLFFDFETTGTNPKTCSILELGFIFSCEKLMIAGGTLKFKFNKKFEDCSEEEKKGLMFNKILNQDDLNKHNSNAYEPETAIKYFVKKTLKHFEYKEFVIVGFNNDCFDNLILNRYLNKYYSSQTFKFRQYSFDVLRFISSSRINKEIPREVRENNFYFYPNNKLETIYWQLFHNRFNAHTSIEDCKATLRIFNHYYKNFAYDMMKHFLEKTDYFDLAFESSSELVQEVE